MSDVRINSSSSRCGLAVFRTLAWRSLRGWGVSVYLAWWADVTGIRKELRFAGAYRTERGAWQRVKRLGAGSVQKVTLGQPVKFTHEICGGQ